MSAGQAVVVAVGGDDKGGQCRSSSRAASAPRRVLVSLLSCIMGGIALRRSLPARAREHKGHARAREGQHSRVSLSRRCPSSFFFSLFFFLPPSPTFSRSSLFHTQLAKKTKKQALSCRLDLAAACERHYSVGQEVPRRKARGLGDAGELNLLFFFFFFGTREKFRLAVFFFSRSLARYPLVSASSFLSFVSQPPASLTSSPSSPGASLPPPTHTTIRRSTTSPRRRPQRPKSRPASTPPTAATRPTSRRRSSRTRTC